LDSESIQILSFRDVGGGALEGPPEPHHVFLANALEKVLWSLHHFDLSQVDRVLSMIRVFVSLLLIMLPEFIRQPSGASPEAMEKTMKN